MAPSVCATWHPLSVLQISDIPLATLPTLRQVMFPLLAVLLEPIDNEVAAVEETRMRAATLLCKAFLQHLSPLLALPGFTGTPIPLLYKVFSWKYHLSD